MKVEDMKNPKTVHGITFDEFSNPHDGKYIVHFAHGFDPFPGDGFKQLDTPEDIERFILNHPYYAIIGIYRLNAVEVK